MKEMHNADDDGEKKTKKLFSTDDEEMQKPKVNKVKSISQDADAENDDNIDNNRTNET